MTLLYPTSRGKRHWRRPRGVVKTGVKKNQERVEQRPHFFLPKSVVFFFLILPDFMKTGQTESDSKSFLNDLLGGMVSQSDLWIPFLLPFLNPSSKGTCGPGISKFPL